MCNGFMTHSNTHHYSSFPCAALRPIAATPHHNHFNECAGFKGICRPRYALVRSSQKHSVKVA